MFINFQKGTEAGRAGQKPDPAQTSVRQDDKMTFASLLAQNQQSTSKENAVTRTTGEEGTDKNLPSRDQRTELKTLSGRSVSTMALGEEGGQTPPAPKPNVSTMAVGEEGGQMPPAPRPNVSTMAVGEEGGQMSPVSSACPPAPGTRSAERRAVLCDIRQNLHDLSKNFQKFTHIATTDGTGFCMPPGAGWPGCGDNAPATFTRAAGEEGASWNNMAGAHNDGLEPFDPVGGASGYSAQFASIQSLITSLFSSVDGMADLYKDEDDDNE